MPLLIILTVLIIAGAFLWLFNAYFPVSNKFKNIFNIVAAILVLFWILKILGVSMIE